jgi:hypothetical protein
MSVTQFVSRTGFGRSAEEFPSAKRQSGPDINRARQRLHGYQSVLSSLSPEQRKRVLADVGPEVAGIPGLYRK